MSDEIVSKFFAMMESEKILDIGYAVPLDVSVLVEVDDEDKHLTDFKELKARLSGAIEELFKDPERCKRFKLEMLYKVECLPDSPE